MSKKSKRRKSRRLSSSSSSSEDEKTSTNKTGSTKRKRCSADELKHVKVQKTKDDTRSSKDERRKREIKKPQSSSTTISPYQILPNLDTWTSSETAPSYSSYDQMQVVEELQQARSERLLQVDVMQTCGELTSMEIDPPDCRATDTECKGPSQQDVIIVLDTNILLSHLTYVKDIVTCGLKGGGLPVVLIPWVVLQELDCLKKKQALAQQAVKAISYINTSLRNRERRVWGQSIQQATESSLSSKTENNDDRVLRCCLQYQRLHQGVAVVLCTNDKNLCSKALLSGVKAFSKEDLENELTSSSPCSSPPQNPQTSTSTAKAYHSQEVTSHSLEKERDRQNKNLETQRHLSGLVHDLKSCLQMALSDVLEAEMKAAFSDMWLEIVYRKPPWSLDDVLLCMKKHWIAVFGHVITRNKQQNVLNLIEFFSSGKSVTKISMLAALHESQDLLNEFATKSSHVAGAICVVKNILNSLQTQEESSADDIVMKEAEEDKQVAPSPCKVWTHFANIWDHVYKSSLRVFEALSFDPLASVSVPLGRPPPPQDVLLCLDHLRSTVTQMLQAFSSFMTSPDLVEAQSLLSLLQSTPAVKADNLTAADILDCFSQQEYRERLGMGGNQLMEMKCALERCLELNRPQAQL
uniref:Transcriptional protein SWT1 n=1 Tax=Knipowitschia caucasica TaxID=637954 RepID=A0AAV2L165_KNICA